jgi:hypothetical protein
MNCNFLRKLRHGMGILNVVFLLIKRFNQNTTSDQDNNTTESNETRPTLLLEMPYIGTKGEHLLRALKRKLLRCLNITNVQIRTRVTTTKLNLFTNAKDKVPKQNKSNVVYQFTCPKCNNSYIGKTDRTLPERDEQTENVQTFRLLLRQNILSITI